MMVPGVCNKSNISSEGQTLHETVTNNFSKASTGKIFEKDLKNIFSMLLICLDLKEESNKYRFYSFNKGYSFSFSIDDALSKMKCLNTSISLTSTTTCMTYRIRQDLAWTLLNRFYEAKLLHSPADRTRSKPKYGTLLQPTPKGVATLQQFCKNLGLNKEQLPPILKSPFNSMDVFQFDRDLVSDKIVYSEYLLYILFIKMMGEQPNYWFSTNGPDESPSIMERLDVDSGYEFNSLTGLTRHEMESVKGFQILNFKPITSGNVSIDKEEICDEKWVSPFHHRYFTNPESDSHVQYYVSSKGVRFYKHKSLLLGDSSVDVQDCTTGKALCQWLCDCTDIMSVSHGMEIANLMLAANFICSVSSTLDSKYSDVFLDKNSYYKLTDRGRSIVDWYKKTGQENSTYSISHNFLDKINYKEFASTSHHSLSTTLGSGNECPTRDCFSLRQILVDPGMKYLFKKHLELEYCSENLEAYLQIKQFEKKVNVLGRLLDFKKKTDVSQPDKLDTRIIKVADSSLSLAYHIFFTYLNFEAPFVLNIDYMLRKRISDIVMGSPTKSHPDKSIGTLEDTCNQGTNKPVRSKSGHSLDGLAFSSKISREVSMHSCVTADGKIRKQDIGYIQHPINTMSPMDRNIDKTIKQLVDITPIFHDIMRHVFRLMEIDSLGKFFKSDVYINATSTVNSLKLPC